MTKNEIIEKMTHVFRDILNEKDLTLSEQLTAHDVDSWDSLAHVKLLFGLEMEFGIKFNMAKIGDVKNIGELAEVIEESL